MVFTDIQTHGVDIETPFAHGWMCPIFKKKDPTDISNYRPITLLNTDYKLLTKVLALQLMDHISSLIHKDQAGFIPKRSIFDQIRLAKTIINYAEVTEENGAIVALDQEKAYDKIKHEYLWDVLEAFSLPEPFIRTIKALYRNATTQIAINGIFSEPYRILRGIRQGDPLSCPLFDLGIEPLACMIRNDPDIKGITIPGLEAPLKVNLFADDTNLYLSQNDKFDHVRSILSDWCRVSGAKFNIGKTEIIPIGSDTHRQQIISTRKIHPQDTTPLNNNIRIAKDGDAVRSLGAWIGNKVNDLTPWEPIIDRAHKLFERWNGLRPTMKGRKIIVQMVVGGLTQFLTKAQGMPSHVEAAFTKMIRKFMWEGDSSPRIALEILQKPIEEGGLNLLDLKARNEAIEIMWLKAYLDFSPSRPIWATITDIIIDMAAPPETQSNARMNSFLQSWDAPTRGKRTKHLNNNITRMLAVGRKYNANLAAIRLTPNLQAQLPAWYHVASEPAPIRSAASKCLLNTHRVTRVSDLISISARIRNPDPILAHTETENCVCNECIDDQINGCKNPHACATEALARINKITLKLNPLYRGNHLEGLTLTRRRKADNEHAKLNCGEILFDPMFTCKNNLAECFRIFTNPDCISNIPASRLQPQGVNLQEQAVTIYTDGTCFNNGKANVVSGSAIWISPNNPRNKAIRIPGPDQSNQVGEISAIIAAASAIPGSWPLKIISDSQYAINGLTTHLPQWEDQGWIGIQNAPFFKKAAYLLRKRTAPTTFQWIKGHSGDDGNEECDRLAKEGARRLTPDDLDLEIPKEFDIQGAKLATLTQSSAYKGIRERKPPHHCPTTEHNIQCTREALEQYNGEVETTEAIWRGLYNRDFRIKVRQFLFKAMHGTQKVGDYWAHIPGAEERRTCRSCQEPETMDHILVSCRARAVRTIWYLARDTWPHQDILWPEITKGLILGCGSISTAPTPQGLNENEDTP